MNLRILFLVLLFGWLLPAGACDIRPVGPVGVGGAAATGGTKSTGGAATGGAIAVDAGSIDAGASDACAECPKCLPPSLKAEPAANFKLGLRRLYSVKFMLGAEPSCALKTVWHQPNDPDNTNQFKLGACTAFTAVNLWSTAPFKGTGSAAMRNAKALDLYHWVTVKDDPYIPGIYPPDDTGSTVHFAWLVGVDSAMWSSQSETAATGDGALCMLQRGPVMVGTDWLDGMFNFGQCGAASVTGPVAGGHAYLLLGYDKSRDVAWFDTSWGNVGVKDARGRFGYFSLTRKEFNQLMANGGEAVRPSPLPE